MSIDQVKAFLADYAASVEKVNTSADAAQKIADLGIVGSAAIAQQAIPRSYIVSIAGDEAKNAASAVLNVLFTANPKSGWRQVARRRPLCQVSGKFCKQR